MDFDQTIIDIHTEGYWKGTAQELSTHVRPLFKHLINAAIQSGIKVAIVTFSPQLTYIEDVLDITFPDISDTISIRGQDRSWSYEGHCACGTNVNNNDQEQTDEDNSIALMENNTSPTSTGKRMSRHEYNILAKPACCSKEGKQSHMASAVEEFHHMHPEMGVHITKNTTLLIDDDANNIRFSLRDGVRAIWLDPSNSSRLLQDLVDLI